jgi:hypothetical protein
MSSKSLAASLFISDVLFENILITPSPKVGTRQNLWWDKLIDKNAMQKLT